MLKISIDSFFKGLHFPAGTQKPDKLFPGDTVIIMVDFQGFISSVRGGQLLKTLNLIHGFGTCTTNMKLSTEMLKTRLLGLQFAVLKISLFGFMRVFYKKVEY